MRNLFCLSLSDAWAPVAGLLSAALLYSVFYAGGIMAARLFAGAGFWITDVYTLKTNVSPRLIALLLVGIIGPGEEIFWRGYFQTRLEEQYGLWGVVLTVGAYIAVHLPSGNPMFIAAAAVCGAFWGLMFRYFRSLWMNMISHAAWDVAIFILWPVHGC